MAARKGFLRLKATFPSFDNPSPYNIVVQRPTSAYYAIETCLEFTPAAQYQQAGLIVREFQTGYGAAIGFEQTNEKLLKVWHTASDGTKEMAQLRYDDRRVYLRIEVEGPIFKCFYSADNVAWKALGPAYYYPFRSGYFTTFHPGLFAGETVETKTECWADFDYFHFKDFE